MHRLPLISGGLEDVFTMTTRNDERVQRSHRELVAYGEGKVVRTEKLELGYTTENAVVARQQFQPSRFLVYPLLLGRCIGGLDQRFQTDPLPFLGRRRRHGPKGPRALGAVISLRNNGRMQSFFPLVSLT